MAGDALDEAIAAYQSTAPRLPQTGAEPLERPSLTPPPAPAPPPPPKPTGILESIQAGLQNLGTSFGGALQGQQQEQLAESKAAPGLVSAAGAATVRAPGQLVGGALDTVADAGRFTSDNISAGLIRLGVPKDIATGTGEAVGGSFSLAGQASRKLNHGASLADTLSMRQNLGGVGDKAVNEFLTQAIAAVLPTPAGKLGLLGRAAKIGLQAGAAADATGATPEARLQERGEQAAIAGTLALGAEVAIPVAKAIINLRGVRSLVEATPHEAAADALDRTYGTLNTTAEREAQARDLMPTPEAKPAEETTLVQPTADAGLPATEGGVPQGAPEATSPAPESSGREVPSQAEGEVEGSAIAHDANGILEHAGADERLPTGDDPSVTPDGKIIVKPETFQVLEDKGTSRGFAPGDPAAPTLAEDEGAPGRDPIIFKEVDDAGGQRVVGSTTQEDLNAFAEEAKAISADPEHINTEADHPSGQWNLRPLGNSDDAAATGRAMVDRLPKDERPVTDASLLAAAKEMGFDSPSDTAILGGILSNHVDDLPKAIVAARLLTRKINEKLLELTTTDWSTVPLGDPRWNDALAAYHNGYSWMQMFRNSKSQVARALRAMGVDLDGTSTATAKEVFGIDGDHEAVPPQAVPDFDTYVNEFGKVTPDAPHASPSGQPPTGGPGGNRLAPGPGVGSAGTQPYPPGQLPPLPRNPGEFHQMVQLLGLANEFGPQAVNRFWQGMTFAPTAWQHLSQSFANWYVGSIVSRLSTYARDIVGPAILGVMRTVEKSSGSMIQAIGNATVGDSSLVAGNLAAAGDSWRAYATTYGDIGDALKAAVRTVSRNRSVLGGTEQYHADMMVPASLINAAQTGALDKTGYLLGNAINLFPQAVHALHGGVNEFALNLAYNGEIRAAALMQGRIQGLNGDALTGYVRDAVTSARDPLTGGATDISQLENGERTVFTRAITNPDQQPIMTKVVQTAQWLQSNIPVFGRLILPILKVPANGLGEQLRRIPGLNLTFRGTQEELSGLHGTIAQAEAYGRMVTGGTALGGGLMLANSGLLTGAGPHNAKDRSDWEAAGFSPYSIKGPDGKWYKYNKLDVIGGMLGIMANMHDMTVYHSVEDEGIYHTAIASVSALAEYVKDQSALRTLSDLIAFGGEPAADVGKFQGLVNGIASGFVPGFLQAGRDALDHDKRIVRDPVQAIMNAIPGTSKMLDPVRNLFGQAVHVPQGEALLPVTVSDVNPHGHQSDVLNEIHRLFLSSGSVPGPLSPSLPGGHKDMRDIPLEDGGSLYDARMRFRNHVTDDNGNGIEAALREVMNSDDYKDGFDGSQHGELSDPNGRLNRSALLTRVFTDFDRRSQEAVSQASPIGTRYMAVGMAKRLNPPGANLHTTDELVHNPALLQSLGIDITSYEDKLRGN